jgi:hypothetical protein
MPIRRASDEQQDDCWLISPHVVARVAARAIDAVARARDAVVILHAGCRARRYSGGNVAISAKT